MDLIQNGNRQLLEEQKEGLSVKSKGNNKMKKEKKIQLNGNDFLILYNSSETDLNQINKMNCGQLISVLLKPNPILTEHKGIETFESAQRKLLIEIKNIINANISFYKNFSIEYIFNRLSLDLYREFSDTYLETMQAYLKIEMKD